ncbi:hypothetical protein H7X46_18645 [Pseudonocardia sp. C8]|uniref:hypothetical protein n=1 Tax=Pseudonocardia sp. C8 TaxID=2762759 RepID=UPI001642E594|nr:hypothetical protein [Pseudonocardia sp. C8]MBC3193082.1 hypothetical protein [Pseudonocardia sp. C8]
MATETTRETETTPAETEAAGTDGTDTGSTAAATTDTTPDAPAGDAGTTDRSPGASDGAEATTTTGSTTGSTTTATAVAERHTPAAGAAAGSGGAVAGGGAVVGAGLGFASLTGTPVTEMLRDRAQLIGQIDAATGMPGNQIEAFYGTPWHTAALVNGVVALIAVAVGAILLLGPARKPGAPSWARPVALGGLLLGVLGLLVAGGMYLDLFAAQPALPAMPGMPGMGG